MAVVAHDAGAANHIFAWLRANRHPDIVTILAGPALTLWRQQQGDCPQLELKDALVGAKTLLSGTGWASAIEHDARRLARQIGIKSIAVIDHWTNYRERFIRDGVKWAHLDIAGMVWADKAGNTYDKGATGFGVRLLDRFVADNYEG